MWGVWDWFKDNTLWVILSLMLVGAVCTAVSGVLGRRRAWVDEQREMKRERHAKKMAS